MDTLKMMMYTKYFWNENPLVESAENFSNGFIQNSLLK